MSYFRATTDASDVFRPSSAAPGTFPVSAGVNGNLADMMRNATVYRVTFVTQPIIHFNNPAPDTHIRDVDWAP